MYVPIAGKTPEQQAIEDLSSENANLKAQVAMLVDDVKSIHKLAELVADYNILSICNKTLSATSESVEAYRNQVKK